MAGRTHQYPWLHGISVRLGYATTLDSRIGRSASPRNRFQSDTGARQRVGQDQFAQNRSQRHNSAARDVGGQEGRERNQAGLHPSRSDNRGGTTIDSPSEYPAADARGGMETDRYRASVGQGQ